VTKDKAQAALWYRKAAIQGDACGDASAKKNLGMMCIEGGAAPKDCAQA
jgi:TPR repeat protein